MENNGMVLKGPFLGYIAKRGVARTWGETSLAA
jgi:hypothetical protein